MLRNTIVLFILTLILAGCDKTDQLREQLELQETKINDLQAVIAEKDKKIADFQTAIMEKSERIVLL